MKLEQQVVSLEIAKRLKELGVKQESVFRWDVADGIEDRLEYIPEYANKIHELVSAYTVAELGKMFVGQIVNFEHRKDGKYRVWWYGNPKSMTEQLLHNIDADTEADARGKMLVYLLENGLLKI